MSVFPKEPGLMTEDYHIYLCSTMELKASYARCCSLGMPVDLAKPQKNLVKASFAHRLATNSLLLALTEQIITPVCCTGPQKNYIFILCDPELAALKIFAAPDILATAEKDGVSPGTVFTEESCGTNALALAREHNRLVAIRGKQHYCKLFKKWLVASPVKDPGGKILGYLDISMPADKELGLTVALLKTLLTSIEREFLLWVRLPGDTRIPY